MNASPVEVQETQPFRIISFDGGGVHAASYLPLLTNLENYLNSTVVGSEQFHMLVGTSTGSIVASALAMGFRANELEIFYKETSEAVFRKTPFWKWPFYKYSAETLRATLAEAYGRKDANDCTWKTFSEKIPEHIEVVVTLWDVTNNKPAFLSSNLKRSGQDTWLHDALLPDIITACCSAPVYFPQRYFESRQTTARASKVYCDGGLTGLNNPALLGAALAYRNQPKRRLHIISFGAGESSEKGSTAPSAALATHNIGKLAILTINALMFSTSRLMDQFHEVFGSALGITAYLRTNQVREQGCNLDDAKAIVSLLQQFEKNQIYCDFRGGNAAPKNKVTMTAKDMAELWETNFQLKTATCSRAESQSHKVSPAPKHSGSQPSPHISKEVRPTTWALLTTPAFVMAVLSMFLVGWGGFYLYQRRAERVVHDRAVSRFANQAQSLMLKGDALGAIAYSSKALRKELSAWHPDEQRVLSQKKYVEEILSRTPRLTNHSLLPARVFNAYFTHDGNSVYLATDRSALSVNLESNHVAALGTPRDLPSNMLASQFHTHNELGSADGRWLLEEGKNWLAEPAHVHCTRQRIKLPLRYRDTPIYDFTATCFSPCGRYLAVGISGTNGAGHPVYVALVWDLVCWDPDPEAVVAARRISALQFSDDGERLLVVASGGIFAEPLPARVQRKADETDDFCYVWRWRKAPRLQTYRGSLCAALSPDGRLVAVAKVGGGVNVFSTDHVVGTKDDQEFVLEIPGPAVEVASGSVHKLLFTRDGKWLVNAFSSESIRTHRISFWQLATDNGRAAIGQPVGRDIVMNGAIMDVSLSSDGTRLLVVSRDDASAGGGPALDYGPSQLDPSMEAVTAALPSIDRWQVFNIATREACSPSMRSFSPIRVAHFSPEGRRVLIASEDRLLKIWDIVGWCDSACPVSLRDSDLEMLPSVTGCTVDDHGNQHRVEAGRSQELADGARRMAAAWQLVSVAEKADWHRIVHGVNAGLPYIGSTANAVPHAEYLIALEPYNARWRKMLGIDLANLSRWDEAAAVLEKAAETGPVDGALRLAQARAFVGLGRYDEADRALQSAEDLGAPATERNVIRWSIAARQEKWPTVVSLISETVGDLSIVKLADADMGTRTEEQIVYRKQFLAAARADCGRAFAELGQFKEAEREFALASENDPVRRQFALWQAQAALHSGNEDGYKAICERLCQEVKNPRVATVLSINDARELLCACSFSAVRESPVIKDAAMALMLSMDVHALEDATAWCEFAACRGEYAVISDMLQPSDFPGGGTKQQAFRDVLLALSCQALGNAADVPSVRDQALESAKKALCLRAEELPWNERARLKRLVGLIRERCDESQKD